MDWFSRCVCGSKKKDHHLDEEGNRTKETSNKRIKKKSKISEDASSLGPIGNVSLSYDGSRKFDEVRKENVKEDKGIEKKDHRRFDNDQISLNEIDEKLERTIDRDVEVPTGDDIIESNWTTNEEIFSHENDFNRLIENEEVWYRKDHSVYNDSSNDEDEEEEDDEDEDEEEARRYSDDSLSKDSSKDNRSVEDEEIFGKSFSRSTTTSVGTSSPAFDLLLTGERQDDNFSENSLKVFRARRNEERISSRINFPSKSPCNGYDVRSKSREKSPTTTDKKKKKDDRIRRTKLNEPVVVERSIKVSPNKSEPKCEENGVSIIDDINKFGFDETLSVKSATFDKKDIKKKLNSCSFEVRLQDDEDRQRGRGKDKGREGSMIPRPSSHNRIKRDMIARAKSEKEENGIFFLTYRR